MGFSIKRKEVNLEEFLTMIENKTEVIEKIDLTKVFFISNLEIKNLTFYNCSFPRELNGIKFYNCCFDLCDFAICDLCNVTFYNCMISSCNFFNSLIDSCSFVCNSIFSSNFLSAQFVNTDLGDYSTDGKNSFLELQCPEEGSFIGYKKVYDRVRTPYLIKLLIPEDAKRSSATTRRCRASKVKVLKILNLKTGELKEEVTESFLLGTNVVKRFELTYKVNEDIISEKWSDDRWYEGGEGIRFFMTKNEARCEINVL